MYLVILFLILLLYLQKLNYSINATYEKNRNLTYIIYDSSSWWEEDFILKELISIPNTILLKLTESSLISKLSYKNFTDRIMTEDIINNNIFIFTCNLYKAYDIFNIVNYLKPYVIIELSDESGDPRGYHPLATFCVLYIRQYCYR